MKIYITADIEGVADVTAWDETNLDKSESRAACQQMTAEVAAACEGALKAGATDVLVKDAHWLGRNIDHARLPQQTRLIRNWSKEPLVMVQGLDESFDALMMIGFHSGSGSAGSPIEHTMDPELVHFKINDERVSEFRIFAMAAAWLKVPVVFVSGDQALMDEIKTVNPHIATVAVKEGVGDSVISIHPELAVERIRTGVEKALKGDRKACLLTLPKHFKVELRFKEHPKARRASYYPGARVVDPYTVIFECEDFFDVLRFTLFA